MKKYMTKLNLLVGMSFLFLVGCSGTNLSEAFNQEEVTQQAKETIRIINNEDSQSLLEMSTVQMKAGLSEDVLEQIYAAIKEAGEFESFEDISVAGDKDKSTEEEYAVAVVNTKYENKKITYTITFSSQMKLAGLYYK